MIGVLAYIPTPDQVQHSIQGWFELIERLVTMLGIIGVGLNQFFSARRNHRENKQILGKQDIIHEAVNGGFREAVNVTADALTHVATLIQDPDQKAAAEVAAERAREKAANMNTAAKLEAARTIVTAVDTLKSDT